MKTTSQPTHDTNTSESTSADELCPPYLIEETMNTTKPNTRSNSFRTGLSILMTITGFALPTSLRAADSIQQPLGYSREFLRDEQRTYGVQVERAATELNAAQDRLTKGMAALAERNLLLTMLYLDDANIRIEGHEQRVAALRSSPLSYSRDKQIHLLSATYADLRAKERRLEEKKRASRKKEHRRGGWEE